MKRAKILMVAFAAMLSVGMVSCCKDDDESTSDSNFVDLGLPSGLLWAKCNLGATTPEGYGNYYAWGETSTKDKYDWSTYKYCTANGTRLQTLTKYNTSNEYGTPDNLTTLEAADDAATAALGSGARTPTKDEWEELRKNTTSEWTTEGGVAGRKFTGTNGNSIFLPAAGGYNGSSLLNAESKGYYWSSSLDTESPSSAWEFQIESNSRSTSYASRDIGYTVRAVRKK